jgi:hypothetical protein
MNILILCGAAVPPLPRLLTQPPWLPTTPVVHHTGRWVALGWWLTYIATALLSTLLLSEAEGFSLGNSLFVL